MTQEEEISKLKAKIDELHAMWVQSSNRGEWFWQQLYRVSKETYDKLNAMRPPE